MEDKPRFLEKYNGLKLGWLHDSLKFIVLIVVVFILFRFVIGLSFISGDSMEPNFHNGECVVYSRLAGSYQPGDVVTVRVPSGSYYIKRVAAVGGDTVDIRDGVVYINGTPYEDAYAQGETARVDGAVIYPYTVRSGNYFLLGDNRSVSMDSRTFGEVNASQIRGKIILRIGAGYISKVN